MSGILDPRILDPMILDPRILDPMILPFRSSADRGQTGGHTGVQTEVRMEGLRLKIEASRMGKTWWKVCCNSISASNWLIHSKTPMAQD
jgi:hypothetical protein